MKVLPLCPKLQARPARSAKGQVAASPARKADLIRLSPDRGRPSQMDLAEAQALLDQTTGLLSQGQKDQLGRLHRLGGDQAAFLLATR